MKQINKESILIICVMSIVSIIFAVYHDKDLTNAASRSSDITKQITKNVTEEPTHTATPTATPTLTPSPHPTNTPTPTPEPTNTPTPTSMPEKYEDGNAPKNIRKSYMSYKAITRKSSDQYKLQQVAYTGEYGIRQFDGRFCVAVGSAYTTKIGTYLDVVLENGTVIECILADCKADQHTDAENKVSGDGSLVEFVVDTSSISKMVKRTGDVSYACDEWGSTVVKVIVYDVVADFK